jgi:hypothetical protein
MGGSQEVQYEVEQPGTGGAYTELDEDVITACMAL